MKPPKLKLTPVATSVSYCIAIPLPIFRDRFCGEEDDRTHEYVYKHLPEGVDKRNIEWSGHFGANVFFTAEDDAGRDAFIKMLEEYLQAPIPRRRKAKLT